MAARISRSTQEATMHREPFLFSNGLQGVGLVVFTHWIFAPKRTS